MKYTLMLLTLFKVANPEPISWGQRIGFNLLLYQWCVVPHEAFRWGQPSYSVGDVLDSLCKVKQFDAIYGHCI